MSGYKIHHENEHHVVINHPDGHQITIAKKGLSTPMLEKLKGFSDGGNVEKAPPVIEEAPNLVPDPQVVEEPVAAAPERGVASSIWDAITQKSPVPPEIEAGNRSATSEAAGVAPQVAQAPLPENVPLQSSPQATRIPTGEIAGGSNAVAKDLENREAQRAQAFDDEATFMKQQAEHYTQKLGELDQENAYLTKQVQDGQVDPHRLFNNMGTGQKISTAVGILLGGIGGGLTGQENPVLKFINSQIDKDIDSQKANLGKNNTLLENNLKQHGNLNSAVAATKMAYLSALEGQLNKIANTAGPATKLKAGNEALLLQAQKQQLASQIAVGSLQSQALRNPNQGGAAGQTSSGLSPEQHIGYFVPEKEQKEAFDELKTAQNARKQATDIMKYFDKSNKENTIVNRAAHAGFEPASVGILENMFLPLIKDREGRINEFEFNTIKKVLPAPGDTTKKTNDKRTGLVEFLNEKGNTPLLKRYGVSLPEISFPQPIESGPGFKK